jgi:hypothetical protein
MFEGAFPDEQVKKFHLNSGDPILLPPLLQALKIGEKV